MRGAGGDCDVDIVSRGRSSFWPSLLSRRTHSLSRLHAARVNVSRCSMHCTASAMDLQLHNPLALIRVLVYLGSLPSFFNNQDAAPVPSLKVNSVSDAHSIGFTKVL